MRIVSRRDFILGLAGLTAAPLLASCGAGKTRPFSVAAHVWPGYETLFLARNQGWLDDRQVRLVETPSATSTLQALSGGIVDGAALTLDEVLRARAQGLPLGVVLVFDISAGADMLLGKPEINRLAELKGRTIGVERGGSGALILGHALQAAGLTTADVRMVSLAPVDQHDAWRQGQLDAVVTYEPSASRLLAKGAVRLYDSSHIPRLIVDVLAIRSSVLETEARSIRHLLAGHFRALDFLRNQFRDAADLMAPRLRLHADEVRLAFKGMELPGIADNRRLLTGPTPELLTSARTLSGSMRKMGLVSREDNFAALLNAEYLPSEGSE